MARWKRNCTDWAPKMCAFARLSGSWCANVAWWHSKCVRAELREPNEAEMGNGKSGVGGFRYNLFWSAQERTRYLPSIECLGNIQVTRSDFMSTCSLWLRNSDLKLGTSPPGSKKLGARTCLGTQRRSVNVTYRWNMVEHGGTAIFFPSKLCCICRVYVCRDTETSICFGSLAKVSGGAIDTPRNLQRSAKKGAEKTTIFLTSHHCVAPSCFSRLFKTFECFNFSTLMVLESSSRCVDFAAI